MKKSILLLGLIGLSSFGLNAGQQYNRINWNDGIIKTAILQVVEVNCFGKMVHCMYLIPKNLYCSIPVKNQIIYLGGCAGLYAVFHRKCHQMNNRLFLSESHMATDISRVIVASQLTYYGYGMVRSYFS